MKELVEDHVLWRALVLVALHLQVAARISIVVIGLDPSAHTEHLRWVVHVAG
jgi:hypothetical protein